MFPRRRGSLAFSPPGADLKNIWRRPERPFFASSTKRPSFAHSLSLSFEKLVFFFLQFIFAFAHRRRRKSDAHSRALLRGWGRRRISRLRRLSPNGGHFRRTIPDGIASK